MSQSDFNGPPQDVSAIRRELEACLNTADSAGILVGNYTYGVYAFYDYDGEPIYVGADEGETAHSDSSAPHQSTHGRGRNERP